MCLWRKSSMYFFQWQESRLSSAAQQTTQLLGALWETKMHPHIDSSEAILAFKSQLLMGSLWFLRFKECFLFKIEASTGPFDIRLIETWLLVMRCPMFINVVILNHPLVNISPLLVASGCFVGCICWSLNSVFPRNGPSGPRHARLKGIGCSQEPSRQCTTAQVSIFGHEGEILVTKSRPPRSQRLCHIMSFPSVHISLLSKPVNLWNHLENILSEQVVTVDGSN